MVGALHSALLKQVLESREEADSLLKALSKVVGEEKVFLLYEWLGAELRSLEWKQVQRAYRTHEWG